MKKIPKNHLRKEVQIRLSKDCVKNMYEMSAPTKNKINLKRFENIRINDLR